MLAVHLDLTNKRVLVVGGGAVGRRKARTLCAAGAVVRLVSLETQPTDFTSDHLVWLSEPFRVEHLDDVVLVVTAATAEVDEAVARLARGRGLHVNVASCPELGDIHFPATVTRGRLLVSIGTHGAAPALAAHLRDRMDDWLPESLAIWVELLDEMRLLAQATIANPERRRTLARALAARDGPALLAAHGIDAVRELLRQTIRDE